MYAPTSTSTDEEVEAFYCSLDEVMNTREHFKFVIGDLTQRSVSIMIRENASQDFFCSGVRSKRGTLLVEWTISHGLYIANTFFQKKQNHRWTWVAPNRRTKNELDYILINLKRTVQDVSVINRQ